MENFVYVANEWPLALKEVLFFADSVLLYERKSAFFMTNTDIYK